MSLQILSFGPNYLENRCPLKLFDGFASLDVSTRVCFSDNSTVSCWLNFFSFLRGIAVFLLCCGVLCLTFSVANYLPASSFMYDLNFFYPLWLFDGLATLDVSIRNHFLDKFSVSLRSVFCPVLRRISVFPLFLWIHFNHTDVLFFIGFIFKVPSGYCYLFCTYTVFYFRTVLLSWRYTKK